MLFRVPCGVWIGVVPRVNTIFDPSGDRATLAGWQLLESSVQGRRQQITEDSEGEPGLHLGGPGFEHEGLALGTFDPLSP
jgi:hypothetical protein